MATKQVVLKIVLKIKAIIALVASEVLQLVTQSAEILSVLELNSVIMAMIKDVHKIVKQTPAINAKVKLEKCRYVFAPIRLIRMQRKNLKNQEDGMTEEDMNKSPPTNHRGTHAILARKDILKANLTSIDNMKKALKHQILQTLPNDMLAMYVALTITMMRANIFILQSLKHVEMQINKKVKNVITAIKLDALTVEYNLGITVLKIKTQHLNA